MKNSKILIIGGTGFIGSHVVERLQKSGFKKLTIAARKFPKNKIQGVKYAKGVDITRAETLKPVVQKAEIVINLAGYISFLRKDWDKLAKINADGPRNLLYLCKETGRIKRFIHVSSTAAFGFHKGEINEGTFFNWKKYKSLPYSYSKFITNRLISQSSQPSNIIYPPLVLGPGSTKNASRLFNLIRGKKIIFAPPGCNALIDVRDLAEAIVLILKKAKNKENYIVIGENLAFTKLFSGIAKTLKQKSKTKVLSPRFCKPLTYLSRFLEFLRFKVPSETVFLGFQDRKFSSAKIRHDLGFKPKFTYRQTLKAAYNYLVKNNLLD